MFTYYSAVDLNHRKSQREKSIPGETLYAYSEARSCCFRHGGDDGPEPAEAAHSARRTRRIHSGRKVSTGFTV